MSSSVFLFFFARLLECLGANVSAKGSAARGAPARAIAQRLGFALIGRMRVRYCEGQHHLRRRSYLQDGANGWKQSEELTAWCDVKFFVVLYNWRVVRLYFRTTACMQ